MFQELLPILSKRSLVLTVTAIESGLVRVTVTPRPVISDGPKGDEPKALSTPLAVEGTADELDRDLPAALAAYTVEHVKLAYALATVKSTMDAELKTAKEEAAKKVAESRKTSGVKPTPKSPVEPRREEPRIEEPPSLFGASEVDSGSTPTPEKQEPSSLFGSLEATSSSAPAPVKQEAPSLFASLKADSDCAASRVSSVRHPAIESGSGDVDDEEDFLLGESDDAIEDDEAAA